MGVITGENNYIYEEEVDRGSAVSEATFNKMGGSINWLIANAGSQLGDIITSFLTPTEFESLRGNNWVIMSGQSIVGSDLHTLTSTATLPDLTTTGRFPRQANDPTVRTSLGTTQSSQNKLHTHNTTVQGGNVAAGTLSGFQYESGLWQTDQDQVYTSTSNGGTEARPEAVKLNYFIKINNNAT